MSEKPNDNLLCKVVYLPLLVGLYKIGFSLNRKCANPSEPNPKTIGSE